MNTIKKEDKERTELLGRRVCFKSDIGINGNLFGGKLLAAIDEISAAWVCELLQSTNVVTLKLYDTVFISPIKEGNIVHFYGSISELGNTSITLKLNIVTLDVENNTSKLVCTTLIKFVQLKKDGSGTLPISDTVKSTIKNNYTIGNDRQG